jgi:UDP-2,3-diacylglucosamine hydrolase
VSTAVSGAGADRPLAIVCGSGGFPFVVADAAARQGRRAVLFALKGFADPAAVARYPHHWIALGQAGRLFRLARADGCRDVVIIGAVIRPAIWQLRLDALTVRLIPRIIRMLRGGDDHLLSDLARVFDEHGFRLIGAHEVAPEILLPEGTLGRHAPTVTERADIARGLALIAAAGHFDIGQAVVVADNRVLAIEAAEGTDDMLARVAALRQAGRVNLRSRSGVLVKAPKPGQERRLDLPSVGLRTVEGAARAGLAGIAVEAAGAITTDLQQLIRTADAAGLFIVGARADGAN